MAAIEVLLTEAGLKDMQERLEQLKTVDRAQVAEEIKIARGFGDLSENAEYDAARKHQAEVEGEIAELENKICHAKIIKATIVDFCEIVEGKIQAPKKYTIVGTAEADISKNCISDESPVGAALMNSRAGDTVEVTLANGKVKVFKVNKVSK